MRLGGPIFEESSTPDHWIAAVRKHGYRAAYCPINNTATPDTIRAYADAAAKAGIVIAEVGAWSNPLSADDTKRHEAVTNCQKQLALADAIGARCCVNIVGSRGAKWDGPCAENLTTATFEMIVETVRTIIDTVKPTRTFYTLETMPWMFPDSPDSYLALLKAIDRPQCAAHLDPVNLVNCPARFFQTGALLRECFTKLGPWIKSCHAKDIALRDQLTVHLDEVRPGTGGLDYRVFLQELNKLHPDTPLMLEHLHTETEYVQAADHIRSVARTLSIDLS
jgi:sugar phosphate isomerase/epimerase